MAGLIEYGIIKPELANSLAAGFQQSLDRQQAQAQQERANKLADLQLRSAQRGEEEAMAEREAYKNAANLADVQQRLMQAGLSKQSLALQKQINEQSQEQLKRAAESHKFAKGVVEGIVANPTRENALNTLAWAESQGANVTQYRAELAKIPDDSIKQWAFTHGVGADKALEQAIIQLPGGGTAVEPKYALGGMVGAAAPAAAAPVAAVPMVPQIAGVPGQTDRTKAPVNSALALPAPGGPGVSGIAGVPGQTDRTRAPMTNALVPPALGGVSTPSGGKYYPPAMTPAQQATDTREQQRLQMERERLNLAKTQAEEGKVPVGYKKTTSGELEAIKGGPADIKSQAQFAQDTTAYNSATSSMDRLAAAANEVLNHPGLAGAVGLRGVLPNVPGTAAANAAAQLATLKSQVGFSVLQDMRNASKTGGALGNVSNEEGKRLESNLAALDRAQSLEQFQASLKKIVQYTEGAKDRLKNAYELKQGKNISAQTSATKPAATGGVKFLGFE